MIGLYFGVFLRAICSCTAHLLLPEMGPRSCESCTQTYTPERKRKPLCSLLPFPLFFILSRTFTPCSHCAYVSPTPPPLLSCSLSLLFLRPTPVIRRIEIREEEIPEQISLTQGTSVGVLCALFFLCKIQVPLTSPICLVFANFSNRL